MRTTEKFDWSFVLLYPYIMVAHVPWLGYRLQMRYTLPLAVLWVIIALSKKRKIRVPRKGVAYLIGALLFLVLYSGIGLLFFPFGHSDPLSYTEYAGIFQVSSFLIIFHLSVSNGRLRELRMLVLFCFVCLGISALSTIRGELYIENASRMLTADTANAYDMIAALEAGTGSYGAVYGLGLVIFPLVYLMKFMPMALKLFFVFLIVVFLLAVYQAAYSICWIGIALAGAVYLVARLSGSLNAIRIFGMVAVAIMVCFVATPSLMKATLNPIMALSSLVGREEYQSRILSVADSVSGADQTYADSRSERYWLSWDTFLKNPVFGIGKYDRMNNTLTDDVGGHSMIFDTLAESGIFGLSLLFLFFFCHYRYMKVMSAVVLGFRWWPAYYIFLFSAVAVAFINPLWGYLILNDLILFIPALMLLGKGFVRSQECMQAPGMPLASRVQIR